jgi:hypothetical protein
VHATETVTGYGAPVTIVVPSKKQLTFVNALTGGLKWVLRSAARDALRTVVKAGRHSRLTTRSSSRGS